jgi:hypothetical protein
VKRVLIASLLLLGATACTPPNAALGVVSPTQYSCGPTPGFCPNPTGPAEASTAPAPAAVCRVIDGTADRRCTPGALNPNVTQATIGTTICLKGWTATVRPPVAYTNALKLKQMVQYGEVGALSLYKEDHIVPLEAGGSPTDPRNLFPQPNVPAHLKDLDENTAQRDICAGRITLKQGQDQILAKWSR